MMLDEPDVKNDVPLKLIDMNESNELDQRHIPHKCPVHMQQKELAITNI